jgi:hypothetical protein
MRAARALQREGRGIIRDGYFETWVNTMPLAAGYGDACSGLAR